MTSYFIEIFSPRAIISQYSYLVCQVIIVRRYGSSIAKRAQILRWEERETSRHAECSRLTVALARANRLGRVFDDRHTGARGNGLTYGWNANVADTLRDRNLLSEQTRDTLVHLQKPSVPDAMWEIAVPNGTYQIIAVSGDPGYFDCNPE